jgi:periplasmic divalent cation tolerance protein
MVLTTCPNREEADRLASLLVRGHAAACVQVTGITSYYEWKGRVNTDSEQLLIIKSRADAYEKIEGLISENHSYEVPEIVRIPIDRGSAAYLGWIDEVSR